MAILLFSDMLKQYLKYKYWIFAQLQTALMRKTEKSIVEIKYDIAGYLMLLTCGITTVIFSRRLLK